VRGWLATRDRLRLASRWLPAEKPVGAAVVLVHGFTASKDHPTVIAVAEALSRDGFHVLTYDGRGHGESEGDCTLGNEEHHDVHAAVLRAKELAPRVITVGASMGAIAVLRHAAAHGDDIDGVVTLSSPARWRFPRTLRSGLAAVITQTPLGRRVAARQLGVRIAGRFVRSTPPAELARHIAVPLAVIHGERDRFILVRDANELYANAAGPRRLDVVSGMGHAYEEAAIPAIRAAVNWALGVSQPA
jgi:alpha-beta hydrolase superfamily lysophospholipase